MQLENQINKKEENVNIYEELFAKRNNNETSKIDEKFTEERKKELTLKDEIIVQNNEEKNDIISKNNSLIDEKNIKENTTKNDKKVTIKDIKEMLLRSVEKINKKYIVTSIFIGIIANISFYHYHTIPLQNKSQILATGLIYNLSENNNLQEIAKNIYIGMKDNGWEPTVKLSNDNIFVFELNQGGEFTITQEVDLVKTKYSVSVTNFTSEMVQALKIQLEPNKIGGTKNFITNKNYNPKTNTISFDIEKIGSGSFDIIPVLPPLPIPELKPTTELTKPITSQNNDLEIKSNISKNKIGISQELEKQLKNPQ